MVNGHTESQMIPQIHYKDQTVVFMADLIPSVGHIPIPYIPSYDTRPLLSLNEKETFLQKAYAENYTLFFQHDAYQECCDLKETERGIKLRSTFSLRERF